MEEGTTVDQFINVAIAEKTAALRTTAYFRERAARADFAKFDSALAKAGNEAPRAGDEPPKAETDIS
ncbi:MAG: toxin-antitoxin system HicB family antitoxin [Gammaproteobacteria bacterium]|nr:toxin-antitoxin system HicB family antitoxin [Gammaproteobacteria bacterium]